MNIRTLPAQPNLDQLKRQAKELLAELQLASTNTADQPALHDAQRILAREYGFDSWPKLKAFVEGVTVRRLAEAVESGDLAKVRAVLESRPELVHHDMAENDERRALHYAVLRRNSAMVQLLMEFGADPNKGIYPHRDATTALAIAEDRGYDEITAIIRECLESNREPEAPAVSASDALTEAIAEGSEEVWNLLVTDQALIHSIDSEGRTPLHIAAAVRNQRLVAWLLEHGADVHRTGLEGETALDYAVGKRWRTGDLAAFIEIATMLRARGASLSEKSAVALGNTDWIRARHTAGKLSGALLSIAAKHGQSESLKLLLDLGFDPDEATRLEDLDEVIYSRGGPLWHAAVLGNMKIAEILLARGADPNAMVYAGGTPVHQAYAQRNWPLVELLTRHGGKVGADTLGHYRETELARAMLNEAVEKQAVAAELLWSGAAGGDPEIVRMSLEHIDWPADDERWLWPVIQPLYVAAGDWGTHRFDRSTFPECFRLILARTDANLRHPRDARTILHDVAAFSTRMTPDEQRTFTTILLDAGARTDLRDSLLGSTPLAWACRWGAVEMVRVLLERGAPIHEPDAEPWATPLAWAEKKDHRAVLQILHSGLDGGN